LIHPAQLTRNNVVEEGDEMVPHAWCQLLHQPKVQQDKLRPVHVSTHRRSARRGLRSAARRPADGQLPGSCAVARAPALLVLRNPGQQLSLPAGLLLGAAGVGQLPGSQAGGRC
jgi:hypothetical protein